MTSIHYGQNSADAAMTASEQKRAALRIMMDALTDGDIEGIDPDCMAQAALFIGLKEFVSAYGEEAIAKFAERLPERIRSGEFTMQQNA